jgi:putative nucleotidyltransferase with HDIG domain
MDAKYVSLCRDWFRDYTESFRSLDPEIEKNIDLKIRHTYRVCDNVSRIAKSLGIEQGDLLLAEVLALFHDIGRFEQLKVFGSFNDRITVDHAKLGLKVLNSSGVFCDLARSERRLLCRAIWLHNKYEIPETERGDALLFSRLIRDADKMDILGVINEHFECRDLHPNSALDFGMLDKPGFSRQAVSEILQGKMVRIPVLETMNDMLLMYLSWVFDIYFPVTLSCIEERGYLARLLANLPDDREIFKVGNFIEEYLARRRQIHI